MPKIKVNGHRWQPLRQAVVSGPEPPGVIEATMQEYGLATRAEAIAFLDEEHVRQKTTYWINDLYQVAVSHLDDFMVQLNIRRRDGAPCLRDWRHFQQIKNELVGPECEAVELYPAESRKVDTSNKYHLWCCKDPNFRFPIGWDRRDVVEEEVRSAPGIRQRGGG